MAGERTLPGLGLYGFWTLGSNGYKDQMDSNLRVLSAVTQPMAESRTTALPASPTVGDVYIVPSDAGVNQNEVAIWDGASGAEAWVYLSPAVGFEFYVADENIKMLWNGTAWLPSGGVKQADVATSMSVDAADLVGEQIRMMESATALTVTVTSGLVGTEPVTFIQKGAGQVSFIAGAGVNIRSADDKLKLRVQYSSATLVRDNNEADTYYLIGDLET